MAIKKDRKGTPIPSFNSDAFDRARVSLPITVFDDKHNYALNTNSSNGEFHWYYVASGGTFTYNGSSSTVVLATNLTSGSSVIKQTVRYHSYEPGKSQLIQMTAVFKDTSQAVEQKIGQFDANNGVFMGVFSGGQWGVGIRSDATGTVVNSVVYQNSWNSDRLDGTGKIGNPSRINLNKNSAICVIDYQWLGLGSARFGFMIDGNLHIVHESHHANTVTVPYMRTSTLPLRYEIKNLATLTTSVKLDTICSTIISEGNAPIEGPTFHISHQNSVRGSITTKRPIFAMRLLPTFKGRTNRNQIRIKDFVGYASANDVFFDVCKFTSASSIEATWLQVSSGRSSCEFSINISSVHLPLDQTTLFYAYAPSGSKTGGDISDKSANGIRDSHNWISLDFAGTTSQVFVVYAASIPGQAATAGITISYEEIQ